MSMITRQHFNIVHLLYASSDIVGLTSVSLLPIRKYWLLKNIKRATERSKGNKMLEITKGEYYKYYVHTCAYK